MDQVMIDVTDVPGVMEGDLVTVYDEETLSELARIAGTIPYELLCAISKRVPRVYVSGEGEHRRI
jgi:alanine racemase